MTRNICNYRRLFGSLTVLCLVAGSFAFGRNAKTSKAKLQELMSIGAQDLPESSGTPEVRWFDLSPDNQSIVVGFWTAEPQHKVSFVIGKWEIASRRLLVKAPLEERTDQEPAFVTLLFTPDGQSLISQTYHAIYILDAKTLEIKHTIHIWSSSPVLSGDGHVLAVTERTKDQSSFHIFDAQSGRLLSQWAKPEDLKYVEDVSLSFRGDQMLIATPWRDPDILLADSFTGKTIRSLSSGYRREQGSPTYGVGSAVFIDSSRFVATPSTDSGKTGRYSGKTLKVFNVDTGELLQEFTYRHLAGQDPWVSPNGSMLALINAWRSPSQNFADVDVGIPVQLLLFRTDTTQPVCVVENIPMPRGDRPEGSADWVRPSPDLSLLGILENNRVTVYKVGNCEPLYTGRIGHTYPP